ncbi:MAG: sodium:proton antiporter [Candidatus Paraimprobicoccus trichonymphae]|uniref:Sodium:proton antiporter n=1 Tax=Candidatus Paraimprobicoccus trichonymphae TaxID=3033793 RepID=A0AA48ICM4_9FIRM|nr:MAG: sodium:proton antiporter [Candidatus Paraimprobicoccus trichonymphae]
MRMISEIDLGIWSIIPPFVAIVLAMITKKVMVSLISGVVSGVLIYSVYSKLGILSVFNLILEITYKNISKNFLTILFTVNLGILIHLISNSGSSQAYTEWVSKKIKSKRLVQIITVILGLAMSIDDYFNCLTVGAIMRPLSEKHKVSKAKFSYILNSMSSPVCVIMPISSWVAPIISCIDSTGLNGMSVFLEGIFYNFYSLFTIIFIFLIVSFSIDFGSMKKFEINSPKNEDNLKKVDNLDNSLKNGKIVDLILPILVLVFVSVFFMLYTGGYFCSNVTYLSATIDIAILISAIYALIEYIPKKSTSFKNFIHNTSKINLTLVILSSIIIILYLVMYIVGALTSGISVRDAFSNTDSSISITLGTLFSLFTTFFLYIPKKIINIKDFLNGACQGLKSMTGSLGFLILAWFISDICREYLGTGNYIANLVLKFNVPPVIIPFIVFIFSGILSFSIGTSWGTFGILIPIVSMICQKVAPDITILSISAVLAGSVFGNHCSPISEVAILSSTASGCNHMCHISSQMPYCILVAVISAVGYLISGITKNIILSFGICLLILVTFLLVIKFSNKKI